MTIVTLEIGAANEKSSQLLASLLAAPHLLVPGTHRSSLNPEGVLLSIAMQTLPSAYKFGDSMIVPPPVVNISIIGGTSGNASGSQMSKQKAPYA